MAQADLAAAVGYSVSFISNLEKEARQPDVEMVAQRFVPALALQDEPRLAARLIELAALARGLRPPVSVIVSRDTRMVVIEEGDEGMGALPVAPTPLIGRAGDVDWVCKRLLGHHGRLLTLLGPPGVGKTRLALEAAATLQAVYADGACFVPLDALEDPALVPATVAAALGLEESGDREPRHRLIQHLRRKEKLLVLDNFEQILPAASLMAELLAACPRLRILVTSRERLHLRAEQRFRVAPLPLADAVELFLQVASAVDPGLGLSAESRNLVEKLCLELDCLPLALELAAAHLELVSLPALWKRLHTQRLDVLSGGPGDLPVRQRALRTAIAFSYERLEPGEQALFRRLSVFAGGFESDAVAYLHGAPSSLEALLSKHLIYRTGAPERPRIAMLETLRAFAQEQLGADELAEVRQRHAAYFLALANEAEAALHGCEQQIWFERLAVEIHNLRATMQHALDAQDVATAAHVCAGLRHFWTMQNRLEEGRLWLDRIQAAGSEDLPPSLRVNLHNSRGSVAFYQGDYQQAAASFRHALELGRDFDDPWGMAFALDGLGAVAAAQGELGRAHDYSLQSLVLSQKHNLDWLSAITLITLGEVARMQGHNLAAAERYEESLSLLRRLGDDSFTAVTLINLAQTALNLGDWQRARIFAQESLQLGMTGAQYHIVAPALEKLAAVWGHRDRPDIAGQVIGASQALRQAHNIPIQPVDRADYDRLLAWLRRIGDAAAFDVALASGQAIAVEEAVALALEI